MALLAQDQAAEMPWDEIDAVVFDVGNVLLRFDPPWLAARSFPGDEALQRAVIRRTTATPYWPMLDRGTLNLDTAPAAMCAGEPALTPAVAKFMREWIDLPPIPEGVAALRRVREMGKRTFVLSNFEREAFAFVAHKHEFFADFDDMLVSSHVGLLKPEPAFFAMAEGRFDLTPARTLFIDDSPVNAEAALNRGWRVFWCREPAALKAFFGLF